jgi:acetyl-CoA C-acetyltransferase
VSDVYIVDAWRTPFMPAGGVLAGVTPQELCRSVLAPARNRVGALPGLDDVVMGNVLNGRGNLARFGLLAAGFPMELPGMTIDRQCASSLEAAGIAFERARLAERPLSMIAGGVESMSQAPFLMARPSRAWDRRPPQFLDVPLSPASIGDPSMIETAETVIREAGIPRRRQDEFALRSHDLAIEAVRCGQFARELVPVTAPAGRADSQVVDRDGGPRVDTDLDRLEALRPVMGPDGSVTAGNASGLADGAAAMVIMNQSAVEECGREPLARICGIARAGVDPLRMGLGPVPAVQRLLHEHGLSESRIAYWEINEAFAGQVLAVVDALAIPLDRMNVHGGAIALGHPLGASGARIVGRLARTLADQPDQAYGVAAMCVGGGMGLAMLIQSCR